MEVGSCLLKGLPPSAHGTATTSGDMHPPVSVDSSGMVKTVHYGGRRDAIPLSGCCRVVECTLTR